MLMNMTGIPRLVMRLFLDRRVPLLTKLILPAGIAYLIMPVDIIPDILSLRLPALGHLDDALVLLTTVVLFLSLAPGDVVSEHLRNGGSGRNPPRRDGSQDDPVIEGSYRVVEDEKERDQ